MIFYQRIGLHDIGPNLASPGDLALIAIIFFHVFSLLIQIPFVNLGTENLHGFRTVFVLRTLSLAGHDDACGQVRDPDGRIRRVHMLATGPAGSIGIHAQFIVRDFDFDFLVDLSHDIQSGKRGVSSLVGVEWTDTYQAMNPAFCFHIPIGIRPTHRKGAPSETSLFTGRPFDNFQFEALPLAIVIVHAQQHIGPVARFSPAGAGMQGDVGITGVQLAAEKGLHLEATKTLFRPGQTTINFFQN